MADSRQHRQQASPHQLLRERRTEVRFPSRLLASCRLGAGRTGVEWPATVHNVSQRGISLVLPRPFSPGCLLTVKLHHEQGPNLLTTQVQVVHVRNDAGAWVLGCEFLQRLDDRDLEKLTR